LSIEIILEQIAAAPTSGDTALLTQLVDALRPSKASQIDQARERLQALHHILHARPQLTDALREYLKIIVAERRMVHLFADTGITRSEGFWNEAWQRLIYRLLPPLVNDEYLRDVFGTIFARVDDHIWIGGLDESIWLELIDVLGFDHPAVSPKSSGAIVDEMLSALQVLSYRISTIGLESELVRNYPEVERHESPFLRQNDEINEYINEYRAWLLDGSTPHRDSQQVEVLLTQCEDVVQKIRRIAAVQGVSVSLTRLLLRVMQSIRRIRTMLALIEARSQEEVRKVGLALFRELVVADNRKYSFRELIRANTDLLTLQVTEHAGRSGEHYVAATRRDWMTMLRSASGAGLIVGVMAVIKILFAKLPLAPFGFAFLFSLNYSLGFMLVHVVHCTIATKQPAMTAALIAKSLDRGAQGKDKSDKQDALDDLAELVVQVLRGQFIAIVGNVALAMPVALLLTQLWQPVFGAPLVDAGKAHHLLQDLNPFASLALFHAAIAGVWLFLSGLISGYFDNKASYSHIPQRLMQLHGLRRLFGAKRWQRITTYIGDNLGALAGNFYFGIMLGSTGQIGAFLGLPIDIRHISFSSANFAIAMSGLNFQVDWQTCLVSLLGIGLIGMTNLAVSFSLALLVALRSRKISYTHSDSLLALVVLVGRRFRQRARDFFIAPPDTR
jgi:site-specific recombinase